MKDKRYHYPETPKLPAREGRVTFPVSYDYNGGIIIKDGHVSFSDGEWYQGFIVNDPIIPAGYELIGIGVGLQLNSYPPLATMVLKKKSEEK